MNSSKPSLILAGMVMIAIVAWLTSVVMSWLERFLCPWRRDISGF